MCQVRLIACQLGPGLGPVGPPPIWVFPSISQIAVWPLCFATGCRSRRPRSDGVPTRPADWRPAHRRSWWSRPFPRSRLGRSVFCHRMSEFPSWLKSPVPTAFQLGPGLATGPPPILVVPSISQIETWPLTVFCHRMSEFPSWLKSPVPTAFQLGPGLTEPAGPPPIFVVPSISQIETWPLTCSARGCRNSRRR